VPVLHGVRLLADDSSLAALSAWLEAEPNCSADAPVIEIHIAEPGCDARPGVVQMLFEEPTLWLGRTAHGLVIGDRRQSWLTVDGTSSVIRGVLERRGDGTIPELLVAALVTALRAKGVYALHAAALCTNGRALVLLGDSGTGKSTTATALVAAGCGYLGDDGILIREFAGEVELRACWPSFRLTDHVVPKFAALTRYLSRPAIVDKWCLDTSAAFPGRSVGHWLGPTTLLFLGRSTQHASTFETIALAEATGLLIAQSNALSLDFHPNPRAHLELLALMARRARVARLNLGSEWLDNPESSARRLMRWARSPLLSLSGAVS
jgi:hypothetical protein